MLRSKLRKLEFRSAKRQMTCGHFGPCSFFVFFFRALTGTVTGKLCDTLRELFTKTGKVRTVIDWPLAAISLLTARIIWCIRI